MLLFAAFIVLTAPTQTADRLELPVSLIDRPFSGAVHGYSLTLRRDQPVMGRVEQKGVDLVVRIRDARDRVLFEVDSPNGAHGPEPIAWLAPADGEYRIEVHPFDERTAGAYDLVLEPARTATRRDRDLADALATYLTAFRERGEALSLQSRGQFPRSNALYRSARRGAVNALSKRTRHLGANVLELVPIHQLLGLIDDEIGDFRSGAQHFSRALELLEKALGPDDPQTVTTRSDLGHLLLAAGDYTAAATIFESVAARRERDGDRSRAANALIALGETHLHSGNLQQAEAALRQVVSIRESTAGPEHPSTGQAQILLGRVLVRSGAVDEGAAICGRIAARLESDTGQAYHRAAVNSCLAEAALHRCEYDEARRRAEAMLRIRESSYGAEDPRTADAHQLLGTIHSAAGDESEARSSFERALKIQRVRLGDKHPATIQTREKIAAIRR